MRSAARSPKLGLPDPDGIEIATARLSDKNEIYTDMLYRKEQRKGVLKRDAQRRVNNNRNVFAACMVEAGDADGMVTGLTRHYMVSLKDISRVLEVGGGAPVFGVSIVLTQDGRALFMTDTAVNVAPTPDQLADFAEGAAGVAKAMGHDPRVAMVSFANFGNPGPAPCGYHAGCGGRVGPARHRVRIRRGNECGRGAQP